jgi:pilus assembly protein CpaB
MEQQQKTKKRSRLTELQRVAGTRRGAAAIAAIAAGLAALLLFAFLGSYKRHVQGGAATQPVLLANRLIPKGTSGSVVVSDRMFELTKVRKDQLQAGSMSDAQAISGKVATHDIYPGEQLKSSDFAKDADVVRGPLAGIQRGIAVPLDNAHGMIGTLRAGDHVDVYGAFNMTSGVTGRGRPELRTIVQDALVLKVPATQKVATSDQQQPVTVRLTSDQAAQVAFAADAGGVWVVLRPPVGAKNQGPSDVTMDAVLAGRPTLVTR